MDLISSGKVTIRISCPGKEDVTMSINLKGWEFTSEMEPEDTGVKVVEDYNRRPKIVKMDE